MIAAQERMMELTQERIAFLEQELERRGEAEERLHRIVAGLTQTAAQLSARIPELEAPESPQGPVPTSTPADPDRGAQEATEQARAGPEERSWWRRVFGR
jgi:hypothetical protein